MKKIFFLIASLCGAEAPNWDALIDNFMAAKRAHEIDSYGEAGFAIAYKSLQELNELKVRVTSLEASNKHIAKQLDNIHAIMQDACALYKEQQRQAAIPWYAQIYESGHAGITQLQAMPWVHTFQESHKLQAIAGVISCICAINLRLFQLKNAFHAENDEHKKEALKSSYQRISGIVQRVIGIEHAVTHRIRDALIGFCGNGNRVKKVWSRIFGLVSIQSLFFMDETLAV